MSVKPGDKAPNFVLQDTSGAEVELTDMNKDHQVVLLFFPLAFTSTCTEELCTTRDNMKLYEALNAKVTAISVDSFFVLKEFKKSHNLNFTLLSDFNKTVSLTYGVLYDDYYGMKGVSKRAAFVIGAEGKIKYLEVLEDADRLPNFKAIHSALEQG